jgi:deoxyribonuclease-4
MPPLGAHKSIAGGIYLAVQRAAQSNCDCVQIFTKNNNQWRAKPLTQSDCSAFQAELAKRTITHPIAHSSYLINLASPDQALWKKSIDAFVIEMQRIEQLGIPYLVLHPGSFVSSTERRGLQRIVRALNEMDRQTRGSKVGCLLETTAGQGSNLGWRFEHLAELIAHVSSPTRFGVCFDTCHVFAAGYALASEKEYRATMREFNRVVGTKQIKAFHLNDSQRECGSRVDRHAHIGRGKIGLAGFCGLMNDQRFAKIPMYLETPKGKPRGRDLDKANLKRLRSLIEA